MRRPDASDPFDRIPKVELHCHVEGTVRSATVVELARKAGRPLPVDDPAELYRYDSLDSFLSIFWLVQETIVTRDDWARIAYESLIDGSAHGLRYREMFFTPARHLATGQDLEAIIAGLTDGIEAAEAETNVRGRLIADMDRAYGPAAGLEIIDTLTSEPSLKAYHLLPGVRGDLVPDALILAVRPHVRLVAEDPRHSIHGDAGLPQVQPVRGARAHGRDHGHTGPHLLRGALDRLHDLRRQR